MRDWHPSVVLLKKIAKSFEGKPSVIKMNQVTLDMLRFATPGPELDETMLNGARLKLDNHLETGEVTITGSVLKQAE